MGRRRSNCSRVRRWKLKSRRMSCRSPGWMIRQEELWLLKWMVNRSGHSRPMSRLPIRRGGSTLLRTVAACWGCRSGSIGFGYRQRGSRCGCSGCLVMTGGKDHYGARKISPRMARHYFLPRKTRKILVESTGEKAGGIGCNPILPEATGNCRGLLCVEWTYLIQVLFELVALLRIDLVS